MATDVNAFDELFDQAERDNKVSLEDWIAGKESGFEERMVKYVMTKVGLTSEIPVLKKALQEWSGATDVTLNFNWFHETYSSFPVRLCAKSYVKAHENTLQDMFKRLTNTRMYKAFSEAKELIPDGEQFASWGLIFPWNGLGYMVIHNHPIEVTGTRIMRKFANNQIVYLDILSDFLAAIASNWRP